MPRMTATGGQITTWDNGIPKVPVHVTVIEPTLNPVGIKRVERPKGFSFVRRRGYTLPCCSWLLSPKGRTMRPFECQTASRIVMNVSVPYALSSYELVWMGGRTGR
jgi:hypothetical protein